MRLDAPQLAAFAAVIELGSFDAAAERLHVTPSAVSQRIKALEQRVGQVLVVREKPCIATPAGVPLLRLAAQTAMLESEALAEMGGAGPPDRTRIAMAVNADSMATWFTARVRPAARGAVRHPDRGPGPLGATAAGRRGDGRRHHRAHTGAGVSGAAAGRDALRAGGQRRPTSSVICPAGSPPTPLRSAPSLAWNRDDALQDMLVRKVFRRSISRPSHFVPTAEGFGAAVRAGLGWGMYPEQIVALTTSCGYATHIWTCRCTGSAGSSTVRPSDASPRWFVRRRAACGGGREFASAAAPLPARVALPRRVVGDQLLLRPAAGLPARAAD